MVAQQELVPPNTYAASKRIETNAIFLAVSNGPTPPIPTPRPSGLKLYRLLFRFLGGAPNTYAASKRIETIQCYQN